MVLTDASFTPLTSKIFVSASAPTTAKWPFRIVGSLLFCVFQNETSSKRTQGSEGPQHNIRVIVCLIIKYSGSNEW